ncbi:hypothetical protein [Sulfitobacter mediterraneus]|uniref:hypothetical protein n=1 Tax=Sulfitobacter mediterraneus TaxID=83219 RepID=UPI0019394EC6|nr:hypothetical protein [Sulfitobacter mediterraneus]MBM1569813.1 hypothetical protein [Sulfitobacter mediterraneus]MBM1604265.1 hypothetical protein [Sulfitobacter mediterraneus]MBM1619577.1 hypothetical protein [Sulfitobacter mediterraneus]MBM1627015.1 hypothetical protein [Sulfitobacter mediterraneus]
MRDLGFSGQHHVAWNVLGFAMMPATYALQQLEVQEENSVLSTMVAIFGRKSLFFAITIEFLPLFSGKHSLGLLNHCAI